MLVSLFHKIGQKLPFSALLGKRRADVMAADNNRPNDGPPDLDQLWRDFNKRLNTWLGQGPGGNDSNNSPDMKGVGAGVGALAVIAGFIWMSTGFFIVQEGQTAVVLTFGKYSGTSGPGFNWRWPGPIQSHEIVNLSRVRSVEIGYRGTSKNKQAREALMLTDDENIVDIQFAVQYKLKNPSDWIFNNRDDEDILLRQVAETSIREVVGKSQMDFVLYEGREKVAYDVNQLMQIILDRYRTGVQVTNVTMQNVQPPDQVQSAFEDNVKAGQDQARKKNEGQAYASDVIPKARGEASRIVQDAQAYRTRVSENAAGDAARFKQVVAEYQKAPAVTRDRMYLETMQQIYSNVTKVMVDSKNGNNLLSLPLDKIMAQTAADQAAAAAKAAQPVVPQVVVTPATSATDDASRRGRDSRDREGR